MNSRSLLSIILSGTLFISCGEKEKKEQEDKALATDTTDFEPVTISEDKLNTAQYDHEVVVPGLEIGWGMAFLPDGSMLITEKSGTLIHFKDGKKRVVEGVPEIYNHGQGGFLDVALHPDHKNNGWIYFTYASSEGEGEGGNTALMRAKLKNGKLENKEVLYKASPNTTAGQHFGSRIDFDEEGMLYFSIGERGNREENPQDLSRDGGKVYRLHPDGKIPEDNPFVDIPGAKKAIFSYGHRNPQGMIHNPETNEIWVHEHGPQGGDEINVIKKGANYGWPKVTYGINYNDTPITDKTSGSEYQSPIFYWVPSIAPSGFAYVTSDKYPDLKGDLLVGSLKFRYLEHLTLDGKKVIEREKLLEGIGRVRDVVQAPDGYIYVSVEREGILRLLPRNQK